MKKAFAPIADENSKILILGTMPGERSLALNQYYGHKGNQFWHIMFALFDEPFTADYDARKQLLLRNNVALWDVLNGCEREGSGDDKIRNGIINDFQQFYNHHPDIKSVFFDSLTAQKLYCNSSFAGIRMNYYNLPSPSGRYARIPLAKKIDAWRIILDVLNSKG